MCELGFLPNRYARPRVGRKCLGPISKAGGVQHAFLSKTGAVDLFDSWQRTCLGDGGY